MNNEEVIEERTSQSSNTANQNQKDRNNGTQGEATEAVRRDYFDGIFLFNTIN
jgi:hypothetical protein